MKVGDLVTVLPAATGAYLVIEKLEQNLDKWGKPLWLLYGEDTQGTLLMSDKWMKVIV